MCVLFEFKDVHVANMCCQKSRADRWERDTYPKKTTCMMKDKVFKILSRALKKGIR